MKQPRVWVLLALTGGGRGESWSAPIPRLVFHLLFEEHYGECLLGYWPEAVLGSFRSLLGLPQSLKVQNLGNHREGGRLHGCSAVSSFKLLLVPA